MSDAYAEIKWKANRKKLVEAYDNYVDNPAQHENAFWKAILEFAKLKLYYLELEFSKIGTDVTADDFAQEVAIAVWKGLESSSFRGDQRNFYAWVHRICYIQAAKFFDELKDKKYETVGVLAVVHDEDGKEETVDNPAIYRNELRDSFLKFPDDIQGRNRDICLLMLDGMNYEQVAKELQMSKAAVEMSVRRMREEHKTPSKQEATAQRKKAREDAEKEYQERKAADLARIRASNAKLTAAVEIAVSDEAQELVAQ
jgi:RNA polymerase sigma factor (sigma-70 family)